MVRPPCVQSPGLLRHSCCESVGYPVHRWLLVITAARRRLLCRPLSCAHVPAGAPTFLSWCLSLVQASELGHSLSESVLRPAQEKVTCQRTAPGTQHCPQWVPRPTPSSVSHRVPAVSLDPLCSPCSHTPVSLWAPIPRLCEACPCTECLRGPHPVELGGTVEPRLGRRSCQWVRTLGAVPACPPEARALQ